LRVRELRTKVSPQQIHLALNDLLPHNINILSVSKAPDNFHARHDAVARYYLYQISTRRTAFGKSFVWWIKDRLDVDVMTEAANLLVGRHNFHSFSEIDKEKKVPTIVQVEHSEIFTDGDLICFRIGASHFLWKMVRRIVGMLAEVGRGNYSVKDFGELLVTKSNVPAEFTAPPSGLFLEKVLFRGDQPPKRKAALMPLPFRSDAVDDVKTLVRRRK
jgi:tRNA pseudouridine38-40 synthase